MLRALALALAAASCASPAPIDLGLSTTPDAPADSITRFVVTGDTGKGNAVQHAVGRAMHEVCASRGGCSFALLAGDNAYEDGPVGDEASQRAKVFDDPFAPDAFPFFVALGNHDYGGNGAGWEFWKGDDEIAWSRADAKWRMPARDYAFTEPHADFFALDTNALFWLDDDDQTRALEARLAASTRPWRIAFGHHPIRSDGRHGDAGAFDRVPSFAPGSGERWRRFFDAHLCGHVDAYFSGHDHTLQDEGERCGVQLFVSGAGSSPTKLRRHDRALFASSGPGFALVELTADTMKVTFFDQGARELWSRTVTHAQADASIRASAGASDASRNVKPSASAFSGTTR